RATTGSSSARLPWPRPPALRSSRRMSRSFRSMGVDVLVRGTTDDEFAAVRELFEQWDATFSRFRPDSELNRINADPSPVALLSRTFAYALREALAAAVTTNGLVDPTLGAALEAAGHDRDFALRHDALRLVAGGIATSGSTKRRWRRGGDWQHHLLDPRTGRPAESRWDEVTVAASTCLAADVAAKAAFLLSEHGPGWLDDRRLPGRFRAGDEVVVTDAWAAEALAA